MNFLACDRTPRLQLPSRSYFGVGPETDLLNHASIPEHFLLGAILVRALADLYSPDNYIVRRTLKWFKSDKITMDRFSYQQIIEVLSLRPSQIELINQEVESISYDKHVRKGEESGKECGELVERERLLVSKKKRAKMREALTWRRRVAR